MLFKQLRPNDNTGTLTYFIGDERARTSAVIDPTIDGVEDVLALLQLYDLPLTYVIDTHTHADHISGAKRLQRECGAQLIMHVKTKTKVIPYDSAERIGIAQTLKENESVHVDRYVEEGDVIEIGEAKLSVIYTPGHTDNHMCLLWENRLFTGDILLIGQAGRSDLPGGNPRAQFEVFRDKILPMSDETIIYPGHDYAGNINSTLGYERVNDEFLRKTTFEEFEAFIKDFFPPVAEKIDGEVTLQCGVARVPQRPDEVRNITPSEFSAALKQDPNIFLLDVREPFELIAFGKIPGVHNIPRGQLTQRLAELPQDKNTPVVCICQSGHRSYEAAFILQREGYTNVSNLKGGTSAYLREAQISA